MVFGDGIAKDMKKKISELRQDVVSGEWAVIATGRAKRPHDFLKQAQARKEDPRDSCPFEDLRDDALLVYPYDGKEKREDWWVQVVPNKFPAFGKGGCGDVNKIGPYKWIEGTGSHEVIITRDHTRPLGRMTDDEARLVMRAYQERYRALKGTFCTEYVSIFHNHGPLAGATMTHPHSQLIAIPVVPPDIRRSLEGSARYFREKGVCVHCEVIHYEIAARERIVYENELFVVVAPFASKSAFELRVFPRAHSAHFEEADPEALRALANAMRTALGKIHAGLNDPDFNFFLHTAPVIDSEEFQYYHWHFEIIPKTAIWAGFEIGTGIEISVISPERAAEFLRKVKV